MNESAGASAERRQQPAPVLRGIIAAVQAAIGGTLGVVVGGAVLSPGLARREASWLPAGRLTDLPINQPTPVMLRLERQDGYQRVIDRRAVFLVRTGERRDGARFHLHAPRLPRQLELGVAGS